MKRASSQDPCPLAATRHPSPPRRAAPANKWGRDDHARRGVARRAGKPRDLVRKLDTAPSRARVLRPAKPEVLHLVRQSSVPVRQFCDQFDFAGRKSSALPISRTATAAVRRNEQQPACSAPYACRRGISSSRISRGKSDRCRHRREDSFRKRPRRALWQSIDVRQAEQVADDGRDGQPPARRKLPLARRSRAECPPRPRARSNRSW